MEIEIEKEIPRVFTRYPIRGNLLDRIFRTIVLKMNKKSRIEKIIDCKSSLI